MYNLGKPLQSQRISSSPRDVEVAHQNSGLELALFQAEDNRMVAVVSFASHSYIFSLPENGYIDRYNEIRKKLVEGKYILRLNEQTGLELILD